MDEVVIVVDHHTSPVHLLVADLLVLHLALILVEVIVDEEEILEVDELVIKYIFFRALNASFF